MTTRFKGDMTPDELEYYADGAWYDAEYVHIKGDIPYYRSVGERVGGRILELACGTGRLTIPMAEAGSEVLGVDIAPGMIARAQEKREALPAPVRERLEFMVGDIRDLDLGRTFDAVVLGFNTLMHMITDQALEGALRTAYAHLEPNGFFYFDLHTPHPLLGEEHKPEDRLDPQQMIDPQTGDRYVVTENNEYDARRQINHMRFFYQRVGPEGEKIGKERGVELRLRVIFPRELERWLHLAGFEIIEDWDEFEKRHPFSGRGGRRVVVARKRPNPDQNLALTGLPGAP